jgi:hypothetical protein
MQNEINEVLKKSENPAAAGEGRRTTNSRPTDLTKNVTIEGKHLASGIDSLVLAVDLVWKDNSFFKALSILKVKAKEDETPQPIQLQSEDKLHSLVMEVKPWGRDGYEWMLDSPEFFIRLGDWMRPKSRPSAMIEVRSQALWLYGAVEVVDRLFSLLNGVGALISETKVSRVDLCLDLLIPQKLWKLKLFDHTVTFAQTKDFYVRCGKFTGATIGRGRFSVRIYDKPFEIEKKSFKTWMYDIWNLEAVKDCHRVIRFEFELRREGLRELAFNTVWQVLNNPRAIWAYCTREWLMFVNNRELHKRDQVLLPFWKTVQEQYLGGQCGYPAIRAKIVNVKKKQLAQQMLGQLTSILALDCESKHPCLRLNEQLDKVTESAELIKMDDDLLSERVRLKQGKYLRALENFDLAEAQRAAAGLPKASVS